MSDSRYSLQRIRWRSRRGMLELDLVLVPFTDQYFEQLTREQQDLYIRLLDSEDQDLLAWWLQHRVPSDAGLVSIIELIRERHGTAITDPG
jgi:antitoxin CptB